jgi:hypothetical protein
MVTRDYYHVTVEGVELPTREQAEALAHAIRELLDAHGVVGGDVTYGFVESIKGEEAD